MPKRFTLDLNRMRLNASRIDEPTTNTPRRSDSPQPQSLRHLPLDLENALRHACAFVVKDALPAVSAAQPVNNRQKRAVTLSDTRLNTQVRASPGLDSHPAQDEASSDHRGLSSQPGDSLDAAALWRAYHKSSEVATTRVDQLMCGVEAEALKTQRLRSKSTSTNPNPAVQKQSPRPNLAARGSSMDTTHSNGQSDVTDDNAISTAMTSAAITPARASKRASSSQTAAVLDMTFNSPDSIDLEEMKRKLELHRKRREDQEATHNVVLHKLAMPARKPVKTERQNRNSSEALSTKPSADSSTRRRSRTVEDRSATAPGLPQASSFPVDTDTERQGRTTARERAASTARSLSRGVKEFFRPSSRHARADTHDAMPLPDHMRPSSSRTPGHDEFSGIKWAKRGWLDSVDSLVPVQAVDVPHVDPLPVQQSRETRSLSSRGAQHESGVASIDLNRKLPPLPTLDNWSKSHDGPQTDAKDTMAASGTSHLQPSKTSCDDVPTSFDDALFQDAFLNTNLRKGNDISPITVDAVSKDEEILSTSPWPEMSATFFPGGFDIYGPMRTPSPISESSIRGLAWHGVSRKASLPALQTDLSPVDSNIDDDYFGDRSPESPKVARLVQRISSGNLRAQLVHNTPPNRTNAGPNVTKPIVSTIPNDAKFVKPTLSRVHTAPAATKPLPSIVATRELPKLPSTLEADLLHGPQRPSAHGSRSAHDGRIFDHILTGADVHSEGKHIVLLPAKKAKKQWWKAVAKRKQHDWMSDVEQSGSRSGVLVIDEVADAPVVRY